MAKGKKSFILYCDWIGIFEKLSDEEAGVLIKHIFRYTNDLNPEIENRLLDVVFEPIKIQLKRDLKTYESICERNRANGLSGGRPSNKKKPKKPSGLSGNPEKPKKPDTDTDNGTDNGTENEKQNTIIDFLYGLYPTRCEKRNASTGKCEKDKTRIAALLKIHTKNQIADAIKQYLSDCENSNSYIKNFSTFLNNLPEPTDEKPKMSNYELYKKVNPYNEIDI